MIIKKGILKTEDATFKTSWDGKKVKEVRHYNIIVIQFSNDIKIMFDDGNPKIDRYFSVDGVNVSEVITDDILPTHSVRTWMGDNPIEVIDLFIIGLENPLYEWEVPLTEVVQ